MEIVIRFGKRWYIFFSHDDVNRAKKIWEANQDNDSFEDELENCRIEFAYDLWEE